MTSKNGNERNTIVNKVPSLLLWSADIKQIITSNDEHAGQVL